MKDEKRYILWNDFIIEYKEFMKTDEEIWNNKFEELVIDLVNKTSLGEGIFIYTEPGNLDMFRDAVEEEEYKLVYPLLTSIIDVEKKLYGN